MLSSSVPARLIDAGIHVVTGDARSITYRLDGRAIAADLVLAEHLRSPTAALNHARRRPGHRILVVCETISAEARTALLADPAIDLSVASTGELVLSGRTCRAPTAAGAPRATHVRRWRRRAAERVCVLTRNHLRQIDIASAVAISQQAVSKMTEKDPLPDTPMTETSRRALLAKLTSMPADDGLVETYWYGLDPITEQVRTTLRLGAELTIGTLAGGEVAADTLQPWRVPTRGLVYAEELIDLSDLNLVEATAQQATLTLRVPADPTVWTTAHWWHGISHAQPEIPTVDPVVALQDLNAGADLGDHAPQHLSDWITRR
ncbi:hypothetical protein [Mycobacterium kansasii]|uniref:hypothetical protein n=1 Tax=Mycobacterium kansasii TaxID=1768 RepID=UPI001CE2B73F|nr:hypothetical protein [Mycobacterium kansasii]UCA22962.1 hypothetical protein LA359_28730 [Mycobacterium kansasii]